MNHGDLDDRIRRSLDARIASGASCLVLALALVPCAARAQDVESMPDARGLDPTSALGCSRGDAEACITAGDACTRNGDGARANALYRRAADLALHALHVPARPTTPGRVRTLTAAIGALEHDWALDVVRGAGAHGQRAIAAAAHDQLFGEHAVATWTGRRATISDAFRAVHTWTLRDGGAYSSGVWVGTLRALSADGPCWQLEFAYRDLDFVAFIDEHGRLLAIVHVPEG